MTRQNRMLCKCWLIFLSAVSFSVAQQPNFVVVLCDDLGYGDLSCYDGWVATPNIDALAKNGLRFTDFHSNGAVCSPTRAALMTGCYQQRVGVPGVIVAAESNPAHKRGLADDVTTFAEVLQQRGYATAIYGKWHLGYFPRFNPIRHGFDTFRGYVSGNVDFFSHIDQSGNFDWFIDDHKAQEEGYVTDLITNHALSFIERNKDRPFCVYLPHEAVHYPYQGRDDNADRTVHGKFPNHGSRADKKEAYREMLVALDEGVGKVVDRLQQLDLSERTLICFLSDNGANRVGSNKPLRGFKGSAWEGGHRVPAIFSWPGKIKPKVTNATAMSMDIMPTLINLSRAADPSANDTTPEVHQTMDGMDLSQLLLESKPLPARQLVWDTGKSWAIRDGDWKLVAEKGNIEGLYNLASDPQEETNLKTTHQNKLEQLSRDYSDWQKYVAKQILPQ